MIYENMLDFFYIIQYKCTDWESVRTGKMNISISTLIIFGTVFLMGEHVLARTLETGRAVGYYTHSGKGERSAKARFERFKAEKRLQLEPA